MCTLIVNCLQSRRNYIYQKNIGLEFKLHIVAVFEVSKLRRWGELSVAKQTLDGLVSNCMNHKLAFCASDVMFGPLPVPEPEMFQRNTQFFSWLKTAIWHSVCWVCSTMLFKFWFLWVLIWMAKAHCMILLSPIGLKFVFIKTLG